MVDIHTHILPNIDDGSNSIQTSLQMIDCLCKQGVNNIILTPHFYSHLTKLSDFLDKRFQSFNLLIENLKINSNLILASETYLTDYLFNNEDISDVCINSSEYLLLEIPHQSNFNDKTLNKINRVINTYDVTPIIAHIDRYKALMQSDTILSELIDMGCLTQMNLFALNSGYFKKKKLLKYIQSNFIHFIGSDCHNMSNRPPEYKVHTDIIKKYLGLEYLETLNNNAKEVLKLI